MNCLRQLLFIVLVIMMISVFILDSPATLAESDPTLSNPVDLETFSEAYIVIDTETGETLFENNSQWYMYPASITKIITAIMAIEKLDPNDLVVVSERAVQAEGTRVYLLEDEVVRVEQLLHGLMVSSGNDAAIALAEHMSGSVELFSEEMNEFVRNEVGVENSNFKNPSGLFEEDHMTTAFDMAQISRYAMKNETFRKLVSTESYEWVGEGWETTIYNHHPLTRFYDQIIGVKNGFVSRSGYTLVTSGVEDNKELIVVTLKANSKDEAAADTLKLLESGFNDYELIKILIDQTSYTDYKHYYFPDYINVAIPKDSQVIVINERSGYLDVVDHEDNIIRSITLAEIHPQPLEYKVENDTTIKNFSEDENRDPFAFLKRLIITGFLLRLNGV